MGFAERNGFVKVKEIQVDDMDDALRNRLYNIVHRFWGDSRFSKTELEYVVDTMGFRVEDNICYNWETVDAIMTKSLKEVPWYGIYDVIEAFLHITYEEDNYLKREKAPFRFEYKRLLEQCTYAINQVLEEEKAGYRLSKRQFVKIVDQEELREVEEAINAPYYSVHQHLEKALHLYSDRKNPDYENSIKESISAVEAICCTITGMSGSQATLGNALKKLENPGIKIHKALKEAFMKLYGYTSDSDGIRHGGIDFTNASSEDAKYMLISCSAFVNYLIEKYSKVDK